jgi:hypothetical protein
VARVQRAAEHKRKKILYNLLKFYWVSTDSKS